MKKSIIRVVLASVLLLVMFGTLAIPALAGAPVKGLLNPENGASADAVAKFALQKTHASELKVNVSLRGVEVDTTYHVYVEWRWVGNATADGSLNNAGVFTTSKNGSGRFSSSMSGYSPGVEYRVKVRYEYSPFTIRWIGDWVPAP